VVQKEWTVGNKIFSFSVHKFAHKGLKQLY